MAVLFPGQGSQTEDMGEFAARLRPDLVAMAVELIGVDPFEHIEEGTRFVQPAVFCASLAGWESIKDSQPDYAAGHSLGELAALVAAGALATEDGLRLVVARGDLCQRCIDAAGDSGGMLAVMAARDVAGPLAEEFGLSLANDNGPTQIVLSGATAALDAARRAAADRGVRALPLAVKGRFHSPAMAPVVPGFRAVLGEIPFGRPSFPVLSSTTAAVFEDIPNTLAEGIVRPVRWSETVGTLHRMGVRRFVETGPGTKLGKLLKRSLDGVEVVRRDLLRAEVPGDGS